MRSPSKSITKRLRDVESELNLPPGFRFHPTDEELIVHYLRRKSQSTPESLIVPPIIANVDLYKHDPWQLPEMALFGSTEWYFFTPRDRKYPNGLRPNRATGNGYWKATGADKHIKSKSDPNTTIGIKKSLVFYAGKGINGIKTSWIMHEYRLVVPNPNTISKLDDWVLCRLYNKKNNPKEMITSVNDNIHHNQDLHRASQLDESCKENSGSNDDYRFDSFEYSDGESLSKVNMGLMESLMETENLDDDDNAWLECLSLEDLHHCLEALPPNNDIYEPPIIYQPNQQQFSG